MGGGVMGKARKLSPEHLRNARIGIIHVELNTIFKRIRNRPAGEPTETEKARILELRQQLQELRGAR
jgi:hypothetical protein